MKLTLVSVLAIIIVICGLAIALLGSNWTKGGLLIIMGLVMGGLDLILAKLDEIKKKLDK